MRICLLGEKQMSLVRINGFEFRGHVKASPGTKKAVRVRNKWVSESVVQP